MARPRWWRVPWSRPVPAAAPLPDVGASADEGELIVLQAVLLALKNRILVTTLTTDTNFDATRFYPDARDVVRELVTETRQQSARLHGELKRAAKLKGDARWAGDYRRGDAANLQHRRDVLELIADRLVDHSQDDAWIDALVWRARDMAWAEVSREMERSLARTDQMIFGDAEYEARREERLAEFQKVDIAELIRQEQSEEGT